MTPPRPAPTLADYAACAARRARAPTPTVSLVTVTRNAAATLARTIASVQAQAGVDLEHVVVDGASTDGSQPLIARLLRPQDYWQSEPDRGIADAFNKGIALARGRYVQFLNADDWLSAGQIARAVATLEGSGADFVFGDLIFHRDGRAAYRYHGDPHYAARLHTHLPPVNHPTMLVRRALYERSGLFCLHHGHAMEYDWLQRVQRVGGRGVHDAGIVGHMTHEGVSNRAFRRTAREVRDISIAWGQPAWRAHLRACVAMGKTGASHTVRAHAPGLYEALRRRINPAYQPLGAP